MVITFCEFVVWEIKKGVGHNGGNGTKKCGRWNYDALCFIPEDVTHPDYIK
jgi:hypothetical protein